MSAHTDRAGRRPGGLRVAAAQARRRLCGLLMLWCAWPALAQPAARPVLRIVGMALPPLITAGPTGVEGLVTQIVVTAVRRAGYEPRIEIMPWARAYDEVRDDRVDILMPTWRSPQHETELAFGEQPIFVSEQSLFVRRNAPIPWRGQVADLHGLHLIKLAGALTAPELDEAMAQRRLSVHEAASYGGVMRMLASGRGQVAVAPRLIGQHAVMATGNSQLIHVLEPPLSRQPFYLAFSRAPRLVPARRALDRALARMWADGTVQRILATHRA